MKPNPLLASARICRGRPPPTPRDDNLMPVDFDDIHQHVSWFLESYLSHEEDYTLNKDARTVSPTNNAVPTRSPCERDADFPLRQERGCHSPVFPLYSTVPSPPIRLEWVVRTCTTCVSSGHTPTFFLPWFAPGGKTSGGEHLLLEQRSRSIDRATRDGN